jgi:hypothetical protein
MGMHKVTPIRICAHFDVHLVQFFLPVEEEEERKVEGRKEQDNEKADPTYVDEPGSQSGESSEASDEDND